MTVPIPGAVVFTIFFLLSAFTFSSLLDTWSTQASEFSAQEAELKEHVFNIVLFGDEC